MFTISKIRVAVWRQYWIWYSDVCVDLKFARCWTHLWLRGILQFHFGLRHNYPVRIHEQKGAQHRRSSLQFAIVILDVADFRRLWWKNIDRIVMHTWSFFESSRVIPLKRISVTWGRESVTDDDRVRFSVRSKCRASTSLSCFSSEIRVATASSRNWIGNAWRQLPSVRRESDIDINVENLGPPEMTDAEKYWKDPAASTIVVSFGEPPLLSICGLYSFKRFTIDYWRSRRFRCQWQRRRLFLDVLNQNLRALSHRRYSSQYPTWPFDTWFLELIRKNVVRCKLYEHDFESVCDVKFVTWYKEVCVLIRQYVAWIFSNSDCINTEDFIRIMMPEVFISSESSPVPKVISFSAVLHASRASVTSFFGRPTSKRAATPTDVPKKSGQ